MSYVTLWTSIGQNGATAQKYHVQRADLLLHTNTRTLEATQCHKSVVTDAPPNEPMVIEVEYKGGWDSAIGQSVYTQTFDSDERWEKFVAESLLAACIVPLRFRCKGKTIWENPVPQGPNFFRPVRLAYETETHEAANKLKKDLDSQAEPTANQPADFNGQLIIFKLNFHLCMLHGKARGAAAVLCYLQGNTKWLQRHHQFSLWKVLRRSSVWKMASVLASMDSLSGGFRLFSIWPTNLRQIVIPCNSWYVVVQKSVKFDKSFRSVMEYAAMQRKYNKNLCMLYTP